MDLYTYTHTHAHIHIYKRYNNNSGELQVTSAQEEN